MLDDAFFDEAGLTGLSDDQKQQLRLQVAEIVQNRVALRLAEVLHPEQADRFSNLMDEDSVEAYKYLEEVYPNYGHVLAQEITRAQDEMLADVQTAVKHVADME